MASVHDAPIARRVMLALVGASFALAGCKAQPCTSSDPNLPTPAIDCPAGDLCYLGECVKSCTAGQERAAVCSSDDDCEAARPNCIEGFCSSCENAETCIPKLNICSPVDPVEYPEPPPPDLFPEPGRYPLDGGSNALAVFNGLQSLRDGGVTGPITPPEVTVAGLFDLGEIVDFRAGNQDPPQTTTVAISVYDVSGVAPGLKWRPELSPPRIEQTFIDEIFTLGLCSVRNVTTSTALPNPPQVDLGDIVIGELFALEDAINGEVQAVFDTNQNQYVVQRTEITTGPVQNFSRVLPFISNWLSMSSDGNEAYTAGPWPDWEGGEFEGFHVPFQMTPTTVTRDLLKQDIVVPIGQPQDLTFTWLDYVATGNFDAERVNVRILGRQSEVSCFDREGNTGVGRIDIAGAVLEEFMLREQNIPGTFTLVFERASSAGARVDPAAGQFIRFSLRVRHSYLTNIRFVP